MSMDGFNLAEIHDMPLTTMHVPRDELGMDARRLLQQRILHPDMPSPACYSAAVRTRNHRLYGD